MGFIYKLLNRETGDFYIGQTRKTVEERFATHQYNAKKGADT